MGSVFKEDKSKPSRVSRLSLSEDLEQRLQDHPGDLAVIKELMEKADNNEIAVLTHLNALAKKDSRHCLSSARFLSSRDKEELALVHYLKYLSSHSDAAVQNELADVYERLGRPKKAQELRDKAQEL